MNFRGRALLLPLAEPESEGGGEREEGSGAEARGCGSPPSSSGGGDGTEGGGDIARPPSSSVATSAAKSLSGAPPVSVRCDCDGSS